MREIKFKGLTKDGKWVYGSLIRRKRRCFIVEQDESELCNKCDSLDTILPEIYEVIEEILPETVAQYTDHNDKNGKEIYGEGDIYKDANGIVSVVEMAVDGWALFPVKKRTPVRNLYWHNVCDKTKGVIIGNVHQPELLEDK